MYLKITIEDNLRNILPTEGLTKKPMGISFERLVAEPLPEAPALQIPASNIEALMAARQQARLSSFDPEQVKAEIEKETLAREQMKKSMRAGLTEEVRLFAEQKIDEINDRINALNAALLNTEEIKSSMETMIGQFPDGTQAMLYTMRDANDKNVIFRVRPTNWW